MAGGRRGPAPKPSAVRELEGARKRRNAANEPQFVPPESIEPPSYLDELARWWWVTHAVILLGSRVITQADLTAFEAAANSYSRWRSLSDAYSRGEFPLMITTEKGNQMVNPLFYAMQSADKELNRWLKEFGMTPSSRTGISVEPTKATEDPIEARLKLAQ